MPRKLELVPLDEIRGADRNPKRHHGGLEESIERWGFADAPIRDDRTGQLVAGHGRVAALRLARSRGETPPDGVGVAPDGGWLVPIQTGWSSRTDADAEAFLLAHNRIGEAGGWDPAEPLGLWEWLFQRLTFKDKARVYDPFLGSGTTLIAAARQKRVCYGMEISPAYCDIIRKRWGDWAREAGADPGPDAL